jgi:heme exporter protein A
LIEPTRSRGSDASRAAAPRFSVEDLAVDRGGRRVLEGIGFALDPGEALIVTGPNGAGKSTLIRALLGLVAIAAGRIRIDGVADDDSHDLAPFAHYLGHRDGVKTALTLAENLAFWQDFLGRAGGADPIEALDAVDLADLADLPAAYLSAGQRRRLGIARLLVAHRPVWLVDEPTAALDAASERRLMAMMADHLESGGSIVAATHLPLDLKATRRLAIAPRPRAELATW